MGKGRRWEAPPTWALWGNMGHDLIPIHNRGPEAHAAYWRLGQFPLAEADQAWQLVSHVSARAAASSSSSSSSSSSPDTSDAVQQPSARRNKRGPALELHKPSGCYALRGQAVSHQQAASAVADLGGKVTGTMLEVCVRDLSSVDDVARVYDAFDRLWAQRIPSVEGIPKDIVAQATPQECHDTDAGSNFSFAFKLEIGADDASLHDSHVATHGEGGRVMRHCYIHFQPEARRPFCKVYTSVPPGAQNRELVESISQEIEKTLVSADKQKVWRFSGGPDESGPSGYYREKVFTLKQGSMTWDNSVRVRDAVCAFFKAFTQAKTTSDVWKNDSLSARIVVNIKPEYLDRCANNLREHLLSAIREDQLEQRVWFAVITEEEGGFDIAKMEQAMRNLVRGTAWLRVKFTMPSDHEEATRLVQSMKITSPIAEPLRRKKLGLGHTTLEAGDHFWVLKIQKRHGAEDDAKPKRQNPWVIKLGCVACHEHKSCAHEQSIAEMFFTA